MTQPHPSSVASSRRDLFKLSAVAGLAAMFPQIVRAEEAAPKAGGSIRVAHLTDTHVQPELRAGEGFAAVLRSLDKLDGKPQLILTGGDHIMDSFDQSLLRSNLQWDLFNKVVSENTQLPVRGALGNHDVWGWGAKLKDIDPQAAGYGKTLAVEKLKMPAPYYSFDQGGWHFVMLDNVSRRAFGYYADLGEEQTAWLEKDLAAAKAAGKFSCVVSHIPVLTTTNFFTAKPRGTEARELVVGDSSMHINPKPLMKLFAANNVKLALSGHVHLLDRVDCLGVSYICDGAVSGGWWKGPRQEVAEGYGILDLHPDGTFAHQYATYGWKAEAAEKA